MQFTLIDKITDLQVGESITAVKNLSLAEEYLQDHFPRFPVMPGVLMLEAMFQTSAWLVRVSEDFAHSMVLLETARNVKYAEFVQPGETLSVTAKLMKKDETSATLKTHGELNGKTAVSAKLTVKRYNLADMDAGRKATDKHIIQEMRNLYQLLHRA